MRRWLRAAGPLAGWLPQPHSIVMQAHSAQDRATAARAPCSRPNWRFGPFGAGEERPSSPAQNGPPAQLAGSHGALVTAGPRQLGTKAAGQAGSPRCAALVEPHASLHLAALAAPCSPYSSPRPSPTPRAFPAPAGCSWGPKRLPGPASGLPAGCLPLQRCVLLELCLPALSARAMLQRVHPCSGPGQSGSSWGRLLVLGAPRVALGGSRNVFCGDDLNGRPVLSF